MGGTSVADFALVVKAIRTLWPDTLKDEYAMNLWYSLLQDIDYPTLNKAVQIYCQQSRFAPTPADIRTIAADIKDGPQEGAAYAWEMVMKSLSRADPNAEFAKLPAIVQKVVGGPGTLRAWSRTDTSALQSVQRPLFLKEYERIRNAERRQAALPPQLRYEQMFQPPAPVPQIPDTRTDENGKLSKEFTMGMLNKLRRRLDGLDS